MRRVAKQTEKAFSTVSGLHKILGATMPCSWESYRLTMVEHYGVDGAVLDSMARLGHFHASASSVRFAGAH